mgnify:CR=1 FL=1
MKRPHALLNPKLTPQNNFETPLNTLLLAHPESFASKSISKHSTFLTGSLSPGLPTTKLADDSISINTSHTNVGSKIEIGVEETESPMIGNKRQGSKFKFGQKRTSNSVDVKVSVETEDKSKPSAGRSDHPSESKTSSPVQKSSNRNPLTMNQPSQKTVVPINKPHLKVQEHAPTLAQLKKSAMQAYGYNYSSTNKASLLYIPEGYLKDAPLRTTFSSFNELAKSQKLSKMDNLVDIIQEEYYPPNNSSAEESGKKKNLELLSRKLMFNRMQQATYKEVLQAQKHSVVTPLEKQQRIENLKLSLMPRVRSYPSRQLVSKNASSLDQAALQNNEELPDLVDMRNQKVEYGLTIEEAKASLHITFNYNFFWYQMEKEQISWKPTGREGATLTTAGKLIVMYGGLLNDVSDEIAVYDPQRRTWTQPKMTGEMPFFGRQGHTALEYHKSVIIFGGEKNFNHSMRVRECLNDTRSYNPEKNEWKFHKCMGHILEPRRSHSACIHEKHMLIYGGVSQYGRYLNDIWALNLSN